MLRQDPLKAGVVDRLGVYDDSVEIQDQRAGTVSYRGTVHEQTGLFIGVVITNEDHIALVLAFDGSDDEQHQETLERITQSISVYPPSE